MAGCGKSYVTPKDETDYWYKEAKKYQKNYDSVLEELNEFQANSHELEAEMEAQLNQTEIKLRDLKVFCSKMQNELEDVKEKYENLQKSSYLQTSDLEKKLKTLENYKETSREYIRELEQTNDDLERANRAATASLEDYEYKLNQAIEHNVFLETEIEEKEAIHFADVQHLMEEIRDLKQEIMIQSKQEGNTKTSATPESEAPKSPTGTSHTSSRRRSQEQVDTLRKCTALTIIAEMIKQIGFMEKKLSAHQQPSSSDIYFRN